MSVSSNSTSPAPISPTEAPVRGGRQNIIDYTNRVKAWLDSLTPSGSTAYDTGWQEVTPLYRPGWEFITTVDYRRVASTVYLRGILRATSATPDTELLTAGTLPGHARPAGQNPVLPVATNTGAAVRVTTTTVGAVTLSGSISANLYVYLNGVHFLAS